MRKIWLHFTANKLVMNVQKTTILSNTEKGTIVLNGEKISVHNGKKCSTYLGIEINANLNWNCHSNKVYNKMKNGLYALAKLKRLNNVHCKKLVYDALIKSHLAYGLTAWGGSLSKKNLCKLQTIQKASIRLINNKQFLSHTGNLFKTNSILKIEDLYILAVLGLKIKLNTKENEKNALRQFVRFNDGNTRSRGLLMPVVHSETLKKQINIFNRFRKDLALPLSSKTILKNIKENITKNYKQNCEGKKCFICERTQ